VKEGSVTGPIIMEVTADSADDESCKYFDGIYLRPVIDYDNCTLSSGHKIIIIYQDAGKG